MDNTRDNIVVKMSTKEFVLFNVAVVVLTFHGIFALGCVISLISAHCVDLPAQVMNALVKAPFWSGICVLVNVTTRVAGIKKRKSADNQ